MQATGIIQYRKYSCDHKNLIACGSLLSSSHSIRGKGLHPQCTFHIFQSRNAIEVHSLRRNSCKGVLYLSEGGSWGPWDLVEGIDGYADHWGQSHGEADSQRPAGIHIVIVGDGLVLDHCEDQDELHGQRRDGVWIRALLFRAGVWKREIKL